MGHATTKKTDIIAYAKLVGSESIVLKVRHSKRIKNVRETYSLNVSIISLNKLRLTSQHIITEPLCIRSIH